MPDVIVSAVGEASCAALARLPLEQLAPDIRYLPVLHDQVDSCNRLVSHWAADRAWQAWQRKLTEACTPSGARHYLLISEDASCRNLLTHAPDYLIRQAILILNPDSLPAPASAPIDTLIPGRALHRPEDLSIWLASLNHSPYQ